MSMLKPIKLPVLSHGGVLTQQPIISGSQSCASLPLLADEAERQRGHDESKSCNRPQDRHKLASASSSNPATKVFISQTDNAAVIAPAFGSLAACHRCKVQ